MPKDIRNELRKEAQVNPIVGDVLRLQGHSDVDLLLLLVKELVKRNAELNKTVSEMAKRITYPINMFRDKGNDQ